MIDPLATDTSGQQEQQSLDQILQQALGIHQDTTRTVQELQGVGRYLGRQWTPDPRMSKFGERPSIPRPPELPRINSAIDKERPAELQRTSLELDAARPRPTEFQRGGMELDAARPRPTRPTDGPGSFGYGADRKRPEDYGRGDKEQEIGQLLQAVQRIQQDTSQAVRELQGMGRSLAGMTGRPSHDPTERAPGFLGSAWNNHAAEAFGATGKSGGTGIGTGADSARSAIWDEQRRKLFDVNKRLGDFGKTAQNSGRDLGGLAGAMRSIPGLGFLGAVAGGPISGAMAAGAAGASAFQSHYERKTEQARTANPNLSATADESEKMKDIQEGKSQLENIRAKAHNNQWLAHLSKQWNEGRIGGWEYFRHRNPMLGLSSESDDNSLTGYTRKNPLLQSLRDLPGGKSSISSYEDYQTNLQQAALSQGPLEASNLQEQMKNMEASITNLGTAIQELAKNLPAPAWH